MNSYREFDLLYPLQKNESERYPYAEGAAFYTEDKKRVVDMNEMRIVLGQNNQRFIDAMDRALHENTTMTGNINGYKERLYQYLDQTTCHHFSAVHLTASGSEAVECAVRLARKMTGRLEILSFWNSIHGRTYLSASMSGLPRRKVGQGELAPGIVQLPYPGLERDNRDAFYADKCFEAVKSTYQYASTQEAAAIVVEICQGAGVIMPPAGYLLKLQKWAHEQGMLFVVDEIQSGMGRSGQMYMYQREGLKPDMLLLGKALGNGMHIAALLVKERPPEEVLPALSGGAGADSLACAAACEVFRQLEEGLLEHVREVGMTLNDGLIRLQNRKIVRECRGEGLFAAVEFYKHEICKKVLYKLKERGFLGGRMEKSIIFRPSYAITKEQVMEFLETFSNILDEFEV